MSVGTHEYTVTAVWRTWTASASKSVTVAFGPATHLVLEAASTTPAAGEADNLTVVAKDASNDTVGTFAGTHSLIFEGAGVATNGEEPVVVDQSGSEKNFGEETEITFSEGKATVSSAMNGVMKLYGAETAEVVVSEGSLNNGAGLAVTVKAAATKKLAISALSEQTAATAITVTLTATDEYGNPTTSYAGKKTLTWSGPANSPSGHAPEYPAGATSVTFTSGVGTATAIKLYDAAPTTLTVNEGSSVEGTSGVFTVKAAATKKVHRADAVRTGSGRCVQRDAHCIRRIRQPRHELCGRKDAHLERPAQLAERKGAQLPGDGHLHRRRGHGHRDHAL